ncbi:MAG: JAB domain-containing protein [Cetobacterium sp.]
MLERIDIRLLDHIIIGEDDYFSFYDNGLIEH